MHKRTLGLLLCLLLFAPSLVRAVSSVSQDYDDQGMALYNRGLYAKSIEYFQNAVQADNTNWQAYEDMGNAYAKTNNNPAALNAYENSLRINPNNTELQNTVTQMGGNPNPPANQPANTAPTYNQPPANKVVVEQFPKKENYSDGLPRMDHAKVWTKVEIGYNYAVLQSLFDSATAINGQIAANPPQTGLAAASNSGLNLGAELGFLLNVNNGIALGVRVNATQPYTSNLNLQNGGDFEDENIQPYLMPITLDYYFFIPDKGGRFFISAGVGYYLGMVRVDDNYSYDITEGQPATNEIVGDMYAGNIGFQATIGREFAIGPRLGLEIFARGRYCKISGFQGTISDAYGNNGTFGLMQFSDNSIHADNVGNISATEHFATLDFTGFEAGVGLSFF